MKRILFSRLQRPSMTSACFRGGLASSCVSFSAVCAVSCSLLASSASAQLTETQIRNAVLDALDQFSAAGFAIDVIPYDYEGSSWEQIFNPAFFNDADPYGDAYLDLIYQLLDALDDDVNALRKNSPYILDALHALESVTNVSTTVFSSAEDIGSSSPAQSVHDARVYGLLSEIQAVLESLDFSSAQSRTELGTVADAITNSVPPANAPEPPDWEGDVSGSQSSATEAEGAAESDLQELSSNDLEVWEYTTDLLGSETVLPTVDSDYESFQSSSAGIPLISQSLAWQGNSIVPTFVVEPTEYLFWTSRIQPWRSRIGSFVTTFWRFLAYISVVLVVRREWLFYMSLGKSQQEAIDAAAAENDVF